jgi:hypothetical protein
MAPQHASGRTLQAPILHYSIGTKLTPKMVKHIEDSGIKDIYASDDPSPFHPEMQRLRVAAHANDDWLASMHTSYLKKQLNESAIRGDETNTSENIHFAPRLAKGEDFGKDVRRTGKF